MMNIGVLFSIQPQYTHLICAPYIRLHGTGYQKSIEVRKTKPKLDVPFTGYIYETKGRYVKYVRGAHTSYGYGRGQVIGEFTCDKIDTYVFDEHVCLPTPGFEGDDNHIDFGPGYWITTGELEATCLTEEELMAYGKGKTLYGIHISNLVIYDKPKEITDFFIRNKDICENADFCRYCHNLRIGIGWINDREWDEDDCIDYSIKPLFRPPQSWCYVQDCRDKPTNCIMHTK